MQLGKEGHKELTAEHPIVARKIQKSLKLSLKDSAINSGSVALGLSYISPFAMAMKATSSQIGILDAIINLLPNLVQLKGASLLKFFSRRGLVRTTSLIKAFLWIPIILTGYFFYIGIPNMVWILIGLVGLYYSVSAIYQVAWFSWMGSIVPEEKRGDYFSKRNYIAGLSGLFFMIVGAVILDSLKKIGEVRGDVLGFTLIGFGILFVFSSFFRLWSRKIVSGQYEPKIHIRKKDDMQLKKFVLEKMTSTPFGKFVLYNSLLKLVVAISSPFFAVYMLRNLGLSYLWFILITVASVGFQLIFMPLMGKISDRFGNVVLMRICSSIMFLIPFSWFMTSLFQSELTIKLYLLIIPSLIGGFTWAGYDLATNNYVYDAIKARRRGYALSFLNLFGGIGTFLGALIGSLIAGLSLSFMNSILLIFLVSGIGRFLVPAIGLRHLEEVRPVKKFSYNYMIREFAPVQGIVRETHSHEHLIKRVEHHI